MPKISKIRWLAASLRAFYTQGGGKYPSRPVEGLKTPASEVFHG